MLNLKIVYKSRGYGQSVHLPMVLDKVIHAIKVTGMFAAAYFTGDITGIPFCFHDMLKIIEARIHGSASKKQIQYIAGC